MILWKDLSRTSIFRFSGRQSSAPGGGSKRMFGIGEGIAQVPADLSR